MKVITKKILNMRNIRQAKEVLNMFIMSLKTAQVFVAEVLLTMPLVLTNCNRF